MNSHLTARRAAMVLMGLLVLMRVPSLIQPPGADQELYAYVGQEIQRGGLPYRDAWDQKPPGVHVTYAALFAVWPDERVIPAADLAAAAITAAVLLWLGSRVAPGAGHLAAILFLFFANPAFARLGGMRVRAQCETFIALAVTSAFALAYLLATEDRNQRTVRTWALRLLSGALVGAAVVYKYNAVVYAVAVAGAVLLLRPPGTRGPAWFWRDVVADWLGMFLGFLVPVAATLLWFLAAGACADFWDATVAYNLLYSGETYGGVTNFVIYLVTLPVQQARIEPLWLLGGAACLGLLARTRRDWSGLVAVAWVAAACLSIAINGSRNLPQYFVQATPALAFAAGLGGVAAWQVVTARTGRVALLVLLILGVARVQPLGKWVDYTMYDLAYLCGQLSRDDYLARYGGQRLEDKHAALAVSRLASYLRAHAREDDTVLVFGFSPGALVQSNRRSASRFFWSRPLVVGFNEGQPRYGAQGLLRELIVSRPAVVVLQQHDWQLEGRDSATYFMAQPALARWLTSGYVREPDMDNYLVWRRAA